MLLSAVSVLVVAQSSSEIPEGLMNNPVLTIGEHRNNWDKSGTNVAPSITHTHTHTYTPTHTHTHPHTHTYTHTHTPLWSDWNQIRASAVRGWRPTPQPCHHHVHPEINVKFNNTVPTAQRTQPAWIIVINTLMIFMEVKAEYCKKQTRHYVEKNADFFLM